MALSTWYFEVMEDAVLPVPPEISGIGEADLNLIEKLTPNNKADWIVAAMEFQRNAAFADSRNGHASDLVIANVQAAYTDMVELYLSGRELNPSDLEGWNEKINKGLTHDSPDGALLSVVSGVLRGTQRAYRINDHIQIVDFTELQIHSKSNDTITHYYPPAHVVPGEISGVVARANAIDEHASLRQIAELAYQYYFAHSNVDANKRTTRIFLDYLMLKAGKKPVPYDLRTRLFPQRSVDEIRHDILRLHLQLK